MKLNRNKALLMAYALGLGLSAESMAGDINITDGNLQDWGLFTNSSGRQPWTPGGNSNDKNGTGQYSHQGLTIYYTFEDYTGGNGGFVDPGYGGQAYDAEAIYVTWDADNLYIALVTGHNPNTKETNGNYAAGDFALNFWKDADDGIYDFGIRTPHNFNSSSNPANIGQFTTDVYKTTNDDWLKDPFWGTGVVTSLDTQKLTSQDKVGSATMRVTKLPGSLDIGPGPAGHSHWLYEVSVDKSIFGDAFKNNTDLDISWTMNCSNDVITVQDDIPTIDEPPAWALLGLTLPAVYWRRRRSATC
ncbi:MAG: hypothetical protein KDJ31_02220 [Candidatus Competibacteraceae bacterium]|nr:hypothetical protein [Candidatus Competibacteraceae bacterium]